jgi:NAD(P) transhydrogenase subunit alpha
MKTQEPVNRPRLPRLWLAGVTLAPLALAGETPHATAARAVIRPAGQGQPPAQPAHLARESMDYIPTLFVFMLATFVGLDVIRRVSRLLHTPLMSLTNAISAIAVVGSILVAGAEQPGSWIQWLGLVAVTASITNIVSGFLITDRMLKMFKRREGGKHE